MVTVNEYTKNENLTRADAVVSCFGDEIEKSVILVEKLKLNDGKMIHISDLVKL